MSDQWLYRIYGQEFGPVALELIRSLAASGAIAPDDEVRNAAQSHWILACATTELRDSIKATSHLTVERRSGRDEWFCRGAAGDYGPLKMVDLIQLAVDGELGPDEEIKAHADDYWKEVSSIRRLVELLPFAGQKLDSVATAGTLKLVTGDICQATEGLSPTTETPSEAILDSVESILEFSNPASNMPARPEKGMSQPVESDSAAAADLNREAMLLAAPSSLPGLEDPDVIGFPGALFPRLSSATSRNRTDDSSIDSLINALGGYAALSPLDRSSSISRGDQSDQDTETSGVRWSGWAKGNEFSSVSFSELLSWAVMGMLLPTDFVRRGDEGQYVPAVNVPALFTVHAAANSLSRQSVSPDIASHTKETATSSTGDCLETVETPSTADMKIGLPVADPKRTSRLNFKTTSVTRCFEQIQSIGARVMFLIALVLVVWIAGW